MSGRATSSMAVGERRAGGGTSSTGMGSTTGSSGRTTPVNPLLLNQYQHLTRRHLSGILERLVTEFTGLNFHVAWTPPAPRGWDAPALPMGSSACCRWARMGLAPQSNCRRCALSKPTREFAQNGDGLFFECHLGVLNYLLPIRVRRVTVGIAYLQALNARKRGLAVPPRSGQAAVGILRRVEFHRAARLLRLVVDYLQTLDLAALRKTELTNAGHAVLALEREQVRLHEALKRHLPPAPIVAHRSGPPTHGEAAVRQLLEWIAHEYNQPITLQAYPAKLGMNGAYLSDLFSRAVGVSFKNYLTEFRLLQAKTLLEDFGHTVSEVGYAVGYANANRFRVMFKKATGVAPGIWRRTLRTRSLLFVPWLLALIDLLSSLEGPLFS